MAQRQGVFVSYSHKDKDWLERLRVAIAPVVRDEKIDLWDDTRIDPGQLWHREIEQAIAQVRVAILLVSANFLASDYVWKFELPELLKQRQLGLAFFWVSVSASAYQYTPLKDIQAVNDAATPLDTLPLPQQQAVLVSIADRIKGAMDLSGLAGMLHIADRFATQQDAFLAHKPAPKDEVLHGVMARQEQERIGFVTKGGESLGEIQADDLNKLDSGSQQLIRTYERIMNDLFDRWSELEPKCYARDEVVRQRARAESEQVRRDLCILLGKILNFVEKLLQGPLVDHYMHVRQVCSQGR